MTFLIWGSADNHKIHNVAQNQVTMSKQAGGPGFITIRQANLTFMTKLGWRLVTEKDSLWAQLMQPKYCARRCDTDMFVPKKDASNGWRGITESSTYIKQGIRVEVGNGRNTLFWHHNWVIDKPLIQMASGPIPTALENQPVEYFWDENQGWR